VNPATGTGWCALPDPTCSSGFRWDDVAVGDGVAGECVAGSNSDGDPTCESLVAWAGAGDIWVGGLDGTAQRNLTNDGGSADSAPVWSSDGTRLAFRRQEMIWVMNADGSDAHPLTAGMDFEPRWAPDGAKIAYIQFSPPGERSVWRVDADGTNAIPLTDAEMINVLTFAWSPDSTRIAFTSVRDGNTEIYVMLADGSGETNLTNSTATDAGEIRWSPDGNSIGFGSDRNLHKDLWKMSATGTNPVELNALGTADLPIVDFDWSLDSSKIVFSRLDSGLIGGLHVMNSDGTGEHQITDEPGIGDVHPRVSPDGTRLTWTRIVTSTGESEVWISGPEGENALRLTNHVGSDDFASIRPCP
jgi:Tol biopolymer transport system component